MESLHVARFWQSYCCFGRQFTCCFGVADLLPQPGGKPIDLPGLHNVIHVSDQLFSGGVPEENAGFESLKKLGVKDHPSPWTARGRTLREQNNLACAMFICPLDTMVYRRSRH